MVATIKTFTLGVLVFACIVSMGRSDEREGYDYWWDHPCADDPDGTLRCPFTQQRTLGFGPVTECWCIGEWNDPDHWIGDPGYPDDAEEIIRIWHSNTGYCEGGTKDGWPCSTNTDCPPDDEILCSSPREDYLALGLSTETVGPVGVDCKDTNATADKLVLHFISDRCAGGGNDGKPCVNTIDDCLPNGTCQADSATLTMAYMGVWAEGGPITVEVSDSVTLRPAAITLNAENGEVSITVKEGARLQTDTSD